MSRTRPGTVIIDQLRDRIVTGLYFGKWQPGERLPSIREIADAEEVDRKTAAAAYHRLADEGLVEVKARSGVFLRDDRAERRAAAGPLEQMQRRWLGNTYHGGRALGLDTAVMLRLFRAIGDVEAMPMPVVDEDDATARTVADELVACLGVNAVPVSLTRMAGASLVTGPIMVTTPYYAARVAELAPACVIISATLSLDPLYGLMADVETGTILVVVPSAWIAGRVEAALRQRPPHSDRNRIVVAEERSDLKALREQAACVFVWPGCNTVLADFEGDDCVKPVRLVSESTTEHVSAAILEAALDRAGLGRGGAVPVSMSSADAARSAAVAGAG